jgi:hypothetical protein
MVGMTSDRSRNLNGALVAALELLDARLSAQNKPVRLGTVVVLARGADLAARLTEDELHQALEEHGHDVIGVGIGDLGCL